MLHQEQSSIEQIANAIVGRQPLPAIHCETIEEGYRIQQAVTASINSGLNHDLKAGVTNAAIQQQLGLNTPLLGTLYSQGQLASGCQLSVAKGQELEFEIGVIVNSEGQPTRLVPAVEVVHLAFQHPEDFTIAKVVAANLGADRYIVGDSAPWQEALTEINIVVYRDGLEIARLQNEYSFGSPASGVNWMVNEARKRQLWDSSDKDRLLMLGTCGKALEAQAGDYRVEFGGIGEVVFSILGE